VHYYEDYPYAADEESLQVAAKNLSNRERTCVPLSERALAAKIEAVACYGTQISSFWESDEAMARALTEQARQSGGECYWQEGSQPG
jgi:hypothetical protein